MKEGEMDVNIELCELLTLAIIFLGLMNNSRSFYFTFTRVSVESN